MDTYHNKRFSRSLSWVSKIAGPDEAKHFAAKVLTLKPNYSIEAFQRLTPHTNEATRALFIKAMIASGIPMVSDSN